MVEQWTDLGAREDFPEACPVLKKSGAQRFACVRAGEAVHAVDDRCPHQGYPLSQGTVKDGVLTCEWHNWKFDLTSGGCTFGGEGVRRYPTRVVGGRVHLDMAVDRAADAVRHRKGLTEAILRDDMGRGLREGLRLGEALGESGSLGALGSAFELLAQDGAVRAEYGFDHALAVLADLAAWTARGAIGGEEAFLLALHAVAEPSLHLPARPRVDASRAGAHPEDADLLVDALIHERRDEAEARARALTIARGPAAAIDALALFTARHLYDYGHGAIFLTKTAELCERFPKIAEDLVASITVTLAWATAETALPPFKATRDALAQLAAMKPVPSTSFAWSRAERAAFETEVLSGERPALGATLSWIVRGAPADALLFATAHAAAERLSRFDLAWEGRLDAEVGVLDVTHTVTFAEAALRLVSRVPPPIAHQYALLSAGFIGKLRHADREPSAASPAPLGDAPDLLAALRARDAGRALAIARDSGAAERREAFVAVAPFAAFDAATRPIFYAHTVKNTEALRRLDHEDPFADAGYLRALASFLAPRRSELRVRRTAAVAKKFLADGRPPEGLY